MTAKSAGWVAGLVLVIGAVGAPGLRADDAKLSGDLKAMQGTWVRDGDEGPDARWVIEGDTLRATVNDQTYTCTLTLDPKASPHRTADVFIKEGAGESTGKTSRGIYKLDGETLVFCVGMPGADARPTEFKSVENEAHLFRLKKAK